MAAIILAAGASRRMHGRDKLLEKVDGAPILARIIALAQANCDPVLVCLPPDRPERARLVGAAQAQPIPVSDPARGMGVSLAAGIQSVGESVEEVMVLLGDMPDLTGRDVQILQAAARDNPGALVIRGTDARQIPGHPVIFRRPLFEALSRLQGEDGARALIRANQQHVVMVALTKSHATTDLDTPEDWAAWRKSR